MLRNVAAVVLGIVAGMAVNMAIITLNSSVLFPMPEGLDMQDPEQFNAYLATLPAAAFVVTMAAHLGQSFVGALVAAKVGASHKMVLAMIIGVLSLLGGIMAMTMYEAPPWMMIELPLYLVVAWLGGKLGSPGRQAAA